MSKEQVILIIDFGSQYTQLIARRVRELGVKTIIDHHDITQDSISDVSPTGIILAGSPHSSHLEDSPQLPDAILSAGVPILGICYGMQVMVKDLGGTITLGDKHEFGLIKAAIEQDADSKLLQDIDGQDSGYLSVWMSHADQVTSLPPGFITTMTTDNTPIAAIEDRQRQLYALQFHPEVTHCEQGTQILSNFVYKICQCTKSWDPEAGLEKRIADIRNTVGEDEVVLATSGGVDSTVVACLLHRAIGKQLKCIFIDNGLLRYNEREKVQQMFAQLEIDLHVLDASDTFLQRLIGITEPEQKRKIIGNTFIECFEQEAKLFNNAKWLGQGTIYPDVIESAASGKSSAVIKTHHNVGGLPDDMQLKLLEPVRDLFKDEVRLLAHALGIEPDFINRHPFPGPGLAVRVLGEIQREYLEILRKADVIYLQELKESGWYSKSSQAFTVFMPVKSVGVTGDGRRYGFVIALRAVQTVDFMTANCAPIPHELLNKISSRIINEIPQVSRVVLDISSKPPATIEWE